MEFSEEVGLQRCAQHMRFSKLCSACGPVELEKVTEWRLAVLEAVGEGGGGSSRPSLLPRG